MLANELARMSRKGVTKLGRGPTTVPAIEPALHEYRTNTHTLGHIIISLRNTVYIYVFFSVVIYTFRCSTALIISDVLEFFTVIN